MFNSKKWFITILCAIIFSTLLLNTVSAENSYENVVIVNSNIGWGVLYKKLNSLDDYDFRLWKTFDNCSYNFFNWDFATLTISDYTEKWIFNKNGDFCSFYLTYDSDFIIRDLSNDDILWILNKKNPYWIQIFSDNWKSTLYNFIWGKLTSFEEKIKMYKLSLKYNQKNYFSHWLLGMIYLQQKNYPQCAYHLRMASKSKDVQPTIKNALRTCTNKSLN